MVHFVFISKLLWKIFFYLLVPVWLVVGLMAVLFVHLPRYPDTLQDWAGRLLGRDITLSGVATTWENGMPTLNLYGVELRSDDGAVTRFPKAKVRMDIIASLLHEQFISDTLQVYVDTLVIRRDSAGRIKLSGWELGGGAASAPTEPPWLLQQTGVSFVVRQLVWQDVQHSAYTLHDIKFHLAREGFHQYTVAADLALPTVPVPLFDEVYIQHGKLHGHGTLFWHAEGLRGLYGEVTVSDLTLGNDSAGGRLQGLHSRVELTAETDGRWRLSLPTLDLHAEQQHLPPLSLHALLNLAADADIIAEGGISDLDIAAWRSLFARSALMPAGLREALQTMQPQGRLRNLSWRYGTDDWQVVADLSRWHNRAWGEVPDLRNGGGRITVTARGGQIEFAEKNLRLALPRLYRREFNLPILKGKLVWQPLEAVHLPPLKKGGRGGFVNNTALKIPPNPPFSKGGKTGWQLQIQDLHTATEDIAGIDVQGHIDFPADGTSPRADITLQLRNGRLARVHRYVPDRKVNSKTLRWLRAGLPVGVIHHAEGILRGPLDQLPFDRGEGIVQLKANIRGGTIRYAPRWPEAVAVNAEVTLRGRGIRIAGRGGRIGDTRVQRVNAEIADFTAEPPVLILSGHAEGPGQAGLDFVADSPLHDNISLDNLGISGDVALDLDLQLPLKPNSADRVRGVLHFSGNTLTEKNAAMQLTALNGKVRFSNKDLVTEQMRGRLFGSPATLEVRSRDGQVTVDLQGQANQDFLTRLFQHLTDSTLNPAWLESLSGQTTWQAGFVLPTGDNDAKPPLEIKVHSSLTGLGIGLPEPLAKIPPQPRGLQVTVRLQPRSARHIEVSYGQRFQAYSVHNGGNQWRGNLHFGPSRERSPTLPAQGIEVDGKLPRLSLSRWLALATSPALKKDGRTTEAHSLPSVKLDLHIGQLEAGGQYFHELRLHGHLGNDQGRLNLTAQEAAGTLRYNAGSWQADLKRLVLRQAATDERQNAAPIAVNPAGLPGLSLYCADLYAAGMDLGAVRLQTRPTKDGLTINRLQLTSAETVIEGQGHWKGTGLDEITTLYLILDSTDFAKSLQRFGFAAQTVQTPQSHFEFVGSWPGNPLDFALEKVSGSLKLNTGKGRLVDVEPGVGRVFGLFDLTAVPHRLLLDFSDVFSSGLGFTRISGDFSLHSGYAETANLRLEGPAAQVNIQGRTGFSARTYDQTLTVTPHASNALPVAGALVGGLGVGAAVLVVQKALQSELDETLTTVYQVSGSWQDPVVTKVE